MNAAREIKGNRLRANHLQSIYAHARENARTRATYVLAGVAGVGLASLARLRRTTHGATVTICNIFTLYLLQNVIKGGMFRSTMRPNPAKATYFANSTLQNSQNFHFS